MLSVVAIIVEQLVLETLLHLSTLHVEDLNALYGVLSEHFVIEDLFIGGSVVVGSFALLLVHVMLLTVLTYFAFSFTC